MDKKITYEQIFHSTSNGVVVTDASGDIVYINARAEIDD
jgi:PAS domain-containing protein